MIKAKGLLRFPGVGYVGQNCFPPAVVWNLLVAVACSTLRLGKNSRSCTFINSPLDQIVTLLVPSLINELNKNLCHVFLFSRYFSMRLMIFSLKKVTTQHNHPLKKPCCMAQMVRELVGRKRLRVCNGEGRMCVNPCLWTCQEPQKTAVHAANVQKHSRTCYP